MYSPTVAKAQKNILSNTKMVVDHEYVPHKCPQQYLPFLNDTN